MKRLIAIILASTLLLTLIPATVFSETTKEATTVSTETEDEYIYYSDLFYGYSHYLANAPYLTAHYVETQGILNRVYDDFMDSPKFAWTNIKNSLAMATNLKEWAKMITDASGLTSFTYEKALDAANVDFATQLTGGSEIAKAYGTELKWVKKINDILKVYDNFDKNYDISVMTETEVFNAMFVTIGDSGVLASIDKTTLTTLQEDILPHISTITSRLSKGADILTAAKTIATGIMMEDFRMELIDEILSSTSSGTMLYDGMYRLKNQLKNGFVSYFLDQYLTSKVLNEIADKVVKKITGTVLGDQAGTFALIGAITKVASWIVFDCIFDVPDIDDLTKQMVLSEYAYNLYTLLTNKVAGFSTQFKTEDIYDLEALATAYSAATNAALDASDKIKISSNATALQTVTDKYSDIIFYNEWIDSAKSFIKTISPENRVITDYGTWEITYEEAYLKNGSDTIEDSTLYFVNHNFNGSINFIRWYQWAAVLYGTMTIPQNEELTINGDLSLESDGHVYLINDGTLTVNGSLKEITNASFTNNGSLTVGDSLSVKTDNFGKVVVFGDITQTINSYNDLRVYGDAIIANNTGTTIVDGEGTVVDGVNEGNIYFNGNLKVSGDYINNKELLVRGNTTSRSDTLENNGTATLMGDLILNSSSGMITTAYAKLIMKRENSLLRLGGDYLAINNSCSDAITSGTIVFCGLEQQNIKNLKANNIIVENTNGVKYLSSVWLYGHYNLNGHPLDNNGYSTYVASESATFDNKSDFKLITFPNDSNFNYVLTENFTGNMVFSAYGTLSIPTEKDITIYGNIDFGNEVQLIIDGNLKVVGDVVCNYGSPGGKVNIYVDNCLDVRGNLIMRSDGYSRAGVLKMNNESSELHIGGDFKYYYNTIRNAGTIVLDGSDVQNIYISPSSIPTMVIDNPNGVIFESNIYSTKLFDHKGNNFTLYNNGSGSTFVDYDGDGLKDNVDPHPTIHEDSMNILRTSIINNTTNESLDFNNDGVVDICDLVYLSLKFAA